MKQPGRITVVETVYCQPVDGAPQSFSSAWQSDLRSDEQPFGPRSLLVGEAWTPLELGWVNEPGMVLLTNREEVGADLEVSFIKGDSAAIIVAAGRSCRFCPANKAQLWVRSSSGFCRYTVSALPK